MVVVATRAHEARGRHAGHALEAQHADIIALGGCDVGDLQVDWYNRAMTALTLNFLGPPRYERDGAPVTLVRPIEEMTE